MRPFAAPTGQYAIGMTEYRWTHPERPEPFTRRPDDLRSVAVRAWYPVDVPGRGDAPYVPDMAEFGDGEDFLRVTHVLTNAHQDIAVSEGGPFPVLIYNHGGSWSRFTSTFTTEELASHGYVVFSVGHNGFNKTQRLPNGESVVPDTLPFPEPTGDLLADAHGSWDYLDEYHFPQWVADAAFLLDQLEGMNQAGRFQGQLDLDRVGMFGWSFGGATSIEMLALDPRVDAAIDHDGQLFGSAPRRGVRKPFMLMHGGATPEAPPAEDSEQAARNQRVMEQLMAEVEATDARLKAASTADWYDVRIAGANHGSFSDLVTFIPGASPGIDPARGHRIINAMTVAFFDRYLKGTPSPLLEDPSSEFSEVTLTRRVRP